MPAENAESKFLDQSFFSSPVGQRGTIPVIQHSKSWPPPKFGRCNQKTSENMLEFVVPRGCSVALQIIIYVVEYELHT